MPRKLSCPPDCVVTNPVGVKFVDYNPWPQGKRGSGAKAAGLRYQDRVAKQFTQDCERNVNGFGWAYVDSPWIRYYENSNKKHAQPDGLFINLAQGRVIIVEVKLSYNPRAWWQLCGKYAPLIAKLFPERLWQCSLLAVANSVTPQDTPSPGVYVRTWATPAQDVGIMRLSEKLLPKLRA